MKEYKIKIINVGAIKEVDLTLNKINIFMGEQSSGKSTIAKIISFCNWVEKDVSIRQSFNLYSEDNLYFIEKLETFHKMKGYFNEKSEILYKSKTIELHYKTGNFNINWVDQFAYKRNKISYIPSERSVAILPEIEKVELTNNYIKSFLFDWFDARKNYTIDSRIPILKEIEFYYSDSNKESRIQSKDRTYDILLSNTSSGLQSMTPLIVMIDHLINNIYNDELITSYELDEAMKKTTQMLISNLILIPTYGKDFFDLKERNNKITEVDEKINENDKDALKLFQHYKEVRTNLFKTHSTNLIIEEPEQNLFPETQKTLIYYLLESVIKTLEHSLTLTTHSPYVLYAINNCIMAYLVHDKLSDNEKQSLNCLSSMIDPKLISIYQIDNGYINCIQQEDGLIGENFFDDQMQKTMDEFYLMLNHYS
ncbi:ATP-binding protein [Myroides guanonis]|uniref:AAA ATPase domain-containing protein n=1 Tax=Myroides guanonis TaxID=1150112 RepID=A0A1I3U1U4_9FLAO|nr:hypothetical protein [Myroides guanonis]SFJ76950.1 hypothetical protein SAMN04487893_11597 [Myroides guanonis]